MYDVITVGTATYDVFLKSSLFRVVRDPHFNKSTGFPTGEAECFSLGSKLEIEEPHFSMGGGAVNSAVTFARQKFSTALLIRIGEDSTGEEILSSLKIEGVKVLDIKDKEVGTGYSTILLAPSGERTVLVYRGASSLFKVKEINLEKLKAGCFYIVPGNIELPIIKKIIDEAKLQRALVAVNPSKSYLEMGLSKLRSLFSKVDLVMVNREEAAYLTGVDFGDDVGIFKKLDELVTGIAVMTDGSRGVLVSDGEKIYKAGIFKEKEIADRTGAGDAFGSGFVAGLLEKLKVNPLAYGEKLKVKEDDIKYAIRLGSANATSNVELIGAIDGILTKKQFEEDERWRSLEISVSKLT